MYISTEAAGSILFSFHVVVVVVVQLEISLHVWLVPSSPQCLYGMSVFSV